VDTYEKNGEKKEKTSESCSEWEEQDQEEQAGQQLGICRSELGALIPAIATP